ncbi:MAG: radical SAM protein [Treponema sp.]|nr:radical SAM protein [Treponema sp.]
MHFVQAKTILNRNGMNIYRGCSHGCIYCDSRSKCYHFTHEFEDIEVKQNAPELLAEALRKKRKRCMIGTGSMSDPYIPLEKELCLTRRCLEVIDRYDFGATLITKSDLVLRDMDILERINKKARAVVQMTLTCSDDSLCRVIEPGVCPSSRRFEVLCECQKRGIPTAVWLSPFLPFINDTQENIDGLLDYCIRAGVQAILCFGIGLTLREGNREYFYSALEKSAFSGMKERYIKTFGESYVVSSANHNRLMNHIREVCRKNNILMGTDAVFSWLNEFSEDKLQPSLF